jgi:aminodeoxyfutalosine deaminase
MTLMNSRRTLFLAPVIIDANRRCAPGALLLDGDLIVAAGPPAEVGKSDDWTVHQLHDEVLMPAMVNGHAHLDLSHIGPQPYTGDFTSWVNLVRSNRASEEHAIAKSVRKGVELSCAGGTALIGDIAGVRSEIPLRTLRASGMGGVSFLEFFGIGKSQAQVVELMKTMIMAQKRIERGVVAGLQPHAPYSCGVDVYRAASEAGCPIATHLAETPDELQLIANASGPLRHMLETIGVWDDTIIGSGKHPIEHLEHALSRAPVIAAHVNYVGEHQLTLLAKWGTTVAYCPRASAYFGHPMNDSPPHRYREMIERGINVALGTDSLVCLETADRLGVIDDMRLLHRRDQTDALLLMRMATINGAMALGFDPRLVQLNAGPTAGVIALKFEPAKAIDPVEQVLLSDFAPRWIAGPVTARDDWYIG